MGEAKQKKVDKALDMTFPASDPPASRRATSTEPPARPASRQAPVVSKEQIEAAAGSDTPSRQQKARKRHHGVGRTGLNRSDAIDESGEQHGLGREGTDQATPRRRPDEGE